MAETKQGINWTTLWKKDDWVSVWIGFLILIIFMAGAVIQASRVEVDDGRSFPF